MAGFTDALSGFIARALYSARITSANPTHVNEVFAGSVELNPADFEGIIESELRKVQSESPENKAQKEQMDSWQLGNVGDIQNMSAKSFGNVKAMANNPFQFVFGVMSKSLVRAAGAIGLAFLIQSMISWAIDEAMKPGRMLDRRFKRLAAEEYLSFITLAEQEKLRRGFTEVRVTTQGGLRGGAFQVSGNLFTHQTVSGVRGPVTEYRTDADEKDGINTRSHSTGREGDPMMWSYRRR